MVVTTIPSRVTPCQGVGVTPTPWRLFPAGATVTVTPLSVQGAKGQPSRLPLEWEVTHGE